MFQEHSQVVLNRPLPSLRLESGDVGVVVHVHEAGEAYEVEFIALDGQTIGVETVQAIDLRAATDGSVPHERARMSA